MSGPLQGKLDLHDVLPTPYENLLATDLPWSVANNATIGGVGGGGGWDFFSAACWFTLKGVADANAARGAAVPLGGIVQCYGGELSGIEGGLRLLRTPCGSGDPQARPFSGGLRPRRLRPVPQLPVRLAATTGATALACTTRRSPHSSSGRRPSPASFGTRCGRALPATSLSHPCGLRAPLPPLPRTCRASKTQAAEALPRSTTMRVRCPHSSPTGARRLGIKTSPSASFCSLRGEPRRIPSLSCVSYRYACGMAF